MSTILSCGGGAGPDARAVNKSLQLRLSYRTKQVRIDIATSNNLRRCHVYIENSINEPLSRRTLTSNSATIPCRSVVVR